jgi:hypothetical protein
MSAKRQAANYPEWIYYPSRVRPPDWVREIIEVVAGARSQIDTAAVRGLGSNAVLKHLAPGLQALGYSVEAGRHAGGRIERPVLYGRDGSERVRYDVDAMHDGLGVVVEVEAGRGKLGNAVYRNLIRSSLIVDARFLALGVMSGYHRMSSGREVTEADFVYSLALLDAIYASGRLVLPFEGVLLFGY